MKPHGGPQRPSASRYEQIERDLQCGGNGRELPGRAAASAALEICQLNAASALPLSATFRMSSSWSMKSADRIRL